jgi:benzodiazapine receptor
MSTTNEYRARLWVGLAGWVLASLAAGAVGGLATASSVDSWYDTIAKPDWTPPDWLFGPVWTTLYVLMGVAAWRVWRRSRPGGGRGALGLFGLQLALNAVWSFLFFGLRAPGPAFVELIALWVCIAATAVAFWRWDRLAAGLLAPYLLWVSFAGALNLSIWLLN